MPMHTRTIECAFPAAVRYHRRLHSCHRRSATSLRPSPTPSGYYPGCCSSQIRHCGRGMATFAGSAPRAFGTSPLGGAAPPPCTRPRGSLAPLYGGGCVWGCTFCASGQLSAVKARRRHAGRCIFSVLREKSTAKIHGSPILFRRAVEDAHGDAHFVPWGSCQRSRLVSGPQGLLVDG